MTDEEERKDTLDIYRRAVELLNNNMQGDEAELLEDGNLFVIKTSAPQTHLGIAIAQAMSEHPDLSIDDSWEMLPTILKIDHKGRTLYCG